MFSHRVTWQLDHDSPWQITRHSYWESITPFSESRPEDLCGELRKNRPVPFSFCPCSCVRTGSVTSDVLDEQFTMKIFFKLTTLYSGTISKCCPEKACVPTHPPCCRVLSQILWSWELQGRWFATSNAIFLYLLMFTFKIIYKYITVSLTSLICSSVWCKMEVVAKQNVILLSLIQWDFFI